VDQLLQLGLVEVCDDVLLSAEGVEVSNGAFGVEKQGEMIDGGNLAVLRLIINLILANAAQICVGGDTEGLLSQLQWAFFTLLEREYAVFSQTDRRCFFYIWRLRKAWRRFMVLSKRSRGRRLAVTVIAMGWLLAVEVCQHLHWNIVKKCSDLPARLEIRRDRPFPIGASRRFFEAWKVYIDDFKHARVFSADEVDILSEKVPRLLELAGSALWKIGSRGKPQENRGQQGGDRLPWGTDERHPRRQNLPPCL